MSQSDPEAINLGDVPLGEEGTTAGQNQASQRASYVDGSQPLFSMYVDITAEQDRRMANSWKGDADGILVFTGLFSAAVAALAAVSVGDLRPNSQDVSAFYLSQIYQLLADANGSPVVIPPNLPSPIARFSTPTYAIWVNSLWFLSLTISLTCALLATLLQKWARHYIEITQPRYSPDKRARIRAFFSDGVDKLHLPWAVEALPTLLHLSLFLFFFGLLIFLFNIDHSVFSAVAWWIGLCTAIYACITFMPIFRHDSPYYAPLSLSAWYFVSGTLFLLFRILLHLPFLNYSFYIRFVNWKDHYGRWFLQGLGKIAEETAREPSSETDGRILTWTFDSLDEDSELEKFFSSVPGFCSSTLVDDPLGTFVRPNEDKLLWALIGLMDRTSSSHLVPNIIKERRSAICVKAVDAASLPLNSDILHRIFTEEWSGILSSVELGLFLRRNVDDSDPSIASYSRSAISVIISRDKERKSRWFELTTGHLGISAPVLRNYLAHGDSVLLANCIYITRDLIEVYTREGWIHTPGSRSKTLESVTKFDIQRTLPGLQHDFCDLWNDNVRKAQNPETDNIQSRCILNLRHLRNAYLSLHQDTNAAPTAFSAFTDIDDFILDEPSSYPLCNLDNHRHAPPTPGNLGVATVTAAEDTAVVPPAVPAILPPSVANTTDPSSSLNASNPSGSLSNTASIKAEPATPIIMPSYSVSAQTDISDIPIGSASRVHGLIAGVVDNSTGASTVLSVADIVSPVVHLPSESSPFPPLSGVPNPTNLQSGFPISTHPSTSVTVSSLFAPQAASILDPQVASNVAMMDAYKGGHDSTFPADPHPLPPIPPSDIAMKGDGPPLRDAGPLPQRTGMETDPAQGPTNSASTL